MSILIPTRVPVAHQSTSSREMEGKGFLRGSLCNYVNVLTPATGRYLLSYDLRDADTSSMLLPLPDLGTLTRCDTRAIGLEKFPRPRLRAIGTTLPSFTVTAECNIRRQLLLLLCG